MKRVYIAAIAALAFAGCGKTESRERSQTTERAPIQISVVPVLEQDWPATYEAVGTVRAGTSTAISSRMMGYVRKVHVGLGDRVSAGQVLVTVEAEDLNSQARQAEAALTEVRSAQPEIESAVAAAKAQLDLAQTTFRRMEELFAKTSISRQEYDEASAKVKVAAANHSLAEAKRAQISAKIQQAEQAIRSIQIAQGYSTITAPFEGTITEKLVEPGTLATPGTRLLTIEQAGTLRLEVSVEESRLPQIKVGQSAEVAIDASAEPVNGRVAEIVPSIDAASRTILVKIDLPQQPQLRGGQFGRATFSVGKRRVLAIPTTAMATRGQLQSVYVVEGGVARNRMVTTGAANGDETEVLSGLSATEEIVSPAVPAVTDGSPVEVRP